MKCNAISDVTPRARHYIVPTTASLILDTVSSSARAHGRGLRTNSDRLFVAPLHTIPDRLADDRDLVGLKFALLGAVLVLVALLR